MGSPLSVLVAELVTQNIEESARQTTALPTLCWRYIYRDEIDAFHYHLNGQNTDI